MGDPMRPAKKLFMVIFVSVAGRSNTVRPPGSLSVDSGTFLRSGGMSNSVRSRCHCNRMRAAAVPALAVLLIIVCPTGAESGWFDKGKELLGAFGSGQEQGELTVGKIGAGLKDALRVGTGNVVSRLGRLNGFNADPEIHIPLPEKLQTARTVLARVGMDGMLEDLELRLNRAAEAATPKAKKLFLQAIQEMTIADVQDIYNGPDDAATRYFQAKMSPALAEEMRPVVADSLSEVGAVQSYEAVMGRYESLPFVPDVKADLTGYVVQKGMDGIFYYLAREEAAIRRNPAKRTTELLQKVFGGSGSESP